jgi:uncharacterized damage-inducible protein DinB
MKDSFIMYAKYNKDGNKTILSVLDGFSHEERERERGSFYGSLSGLVRHLLGGTVFFQGMFKAALGHNAAALKALSPLEGVSIPQDALAEDQWKSLAASFETADNALISLVSSLEEADFKAPVQTEWYGGKPPSVPLSFMLHQLITHGIHHRGQISQILDELKIDNDYSGIKVEFL